MALPFSFSSELKWSDHLNNRLGPFENGTDIYAVLIDKTANTVEVWRSTDSGSSWSEQDSANHRGTSTTATQKVVHAEKLGTTISIVYRGPSNYWHVTFSMSSNTWGTATEAIGYAGQVNVAGPLAMGMAVRSDGSVVTFANSAPESIMGTSYRRVTHRNFSGGTWGSNVDVGGTGVAAHYDMRAIVLGSSDRVHLFWTDETNLDLKHRSLTSANVLGTIQTVHANTLGNLAYPVGLPVLNGSEVVIPFLEVGTVDMYAARATSADTPTWSTSQLITATNAESLNSNCGALAVDSSTVYAVYPNDADQDIYVTNDGGTGTWGTEVEWKDAITCQGISITKITSAIGVLYDDGGTVKYDAYSLGAPPATKAPPPYSRPWRIWRPRRSA